MVRSSSALLRRSPALWFHWSTVKVWGLLLTPIYFAICSHKPNAKHDILLPPAGLFGLPFGILPHRVPITTVVGRPINVPRFEGASPASATPHFTGVLVTCRCAQTSSNQIVRGISIALCAWNRLSDLVFVALPQAT